MEGFNEKKDVVCDPKHERQEAFGDVSRTIALWGDEFKERCLESGEKFPDVSVVMYEFALLIEERSKSLLEGAQIDGNYRVEQAVAKLHEFNMVHVDLLKRSAEVFLHYPDTITTLAETYPWILTIREWAEEFVFTEAELRQ